MQTLALHFKKYMKSKLKFLIQTSLTLFFTSFWLFTQAQSIKGRVTDGTTGEPLVGALVVVKDMTDKAALVQLDGGFQIKNLNPGDYVLTIEYLGYKKYESDKITVKPEEYKTIEIAVEPEVRMLQSILVTASGDKEEKTARRLEKQADPVLNILSSKAIQLLPDITVANTLQRVSGITIEKSSSGEARYPIIRGMEKRYINTLINGIKIPSPENKSRFVPLDIFPSELLERLEVSKSLTPSMEGDAIGGTINLVMKDAPAQKLLQANLSVGYNDLFNNQPFQKFDKSSISLKSPSEIKGNGYVTIPSDFSSAHLNYSDVNNPLNTTLGLTYGDRYGTNKKLGFIVSGSYQDIHRGSKSNFFLPNSQPGLNNIPLFSDLQDRRYSVRSKRLGLAGKLDYRINDKNRIAFINTYVRLDDDQTRIVYDTVALNSLVTNWQRSQWQYQSIYNSTLQGQHQISPTFKADWDLVYSAANNHLPDQAQFTHQYAIVSTTLTADKLQGLSHLWSHNKDQDKSAYLNFTKSLNIGNSTMDIKFGGVYRTKSRHNFYYSYSLNPQLNETYSNINNAVWIYNSPADGLANFNGNDYSFDEKISAGYAQLKWTIAKRLEILGGYRIENTHQDYATALGQEVNAKSGTIQYTDVLPSLQFKYAINNNQNLRISYYRALARPQFNELIPDGPDGEFFKERGDPVNLQHTLADNIDLRYEYYGHGLDQFLIGTFYKKLQDPIEISAVKPLNVNSLYLQPVNVGNATNYGLETVIAKYIGAIGFSANYTYTKSSITNDHMIYSTRNDQGQIVSKTVSETRPLQGQSNHIGNVSLIYKNPKLGLDIQIAGVYTGKRINFISPYLGLHYWQSPTSQLDLSFEKRIIHKITLYGKLNNLTNAPFELFLPQSYNKYLTTSGSRALALQSDPENKIIIQKDYYHTSYLFGLRYKF